MTTKEITEAADKKREHVKNIAQKIFKTPEGYVDLEVERFVDEFVNLMILEITALHSQAGDDFRDNVQGQARREATLPAPPCSQFYLEEDDE